jgi:hypothetical protein
VTDHPIWKETSPGVIHVELGHKVAFYAVLWRHRDFGTDNWLEPCWRLQVGRFRFGDWR